MINNNGKSRRCSKISEKLFEVNVIYTSGTTVGLFIILIVIFTRRFALSGVEYAL